MKTLAVRLEDEQHARISILAKLAGVSVTDAIRDAIDAHATTLAADPGISAKATALTADIDREAAEQRSAITALLGDTTNKTSTRTSRAKADKPDA